MKKTWYNNIHNPNKPTDVDALTETAESIFDGLEEDGISHFDLRNLKVDEINCEHLATVLRCTSNWKMEILGWQDALNVNIESCKKNNMDPNDLLFGMI